MFGSKISGPNWPRTPISGSAWAKKGSGLSLGHLFCFHTLNVNVLCSNSGYYPALYTVGLLMVSLRGQYSNSMPVCAFFNDFRG